MEQDLKSAAQAAATRQPARRPGNLNGKPNVGGLKDSARLSPAIALRPPRVLFALPVNGVKIREFAVPMAQAG